MNVKHVRRFPVLIRLAMIGASLCAIGYGAAYYWGIGAACLSTGGLLWWELTRADRGNERNSKPPE